MKVNVYNADGTLICQGVPLIEVVGDSDTGLAVAQADLLAHGTHHVGGGAFAPLYKLIHAADDTPYKAYALWRDVPEFWVHA